MRSARVVLVLVFALLVATAAFGRELPAEEQHGAMELFGVGPELFEDRAKAWVLALAGIVKAAISELGLVLLAVYALREVMKTKGKMKEQVAEVHDRLDRQRHDIDATKATVNANASAAAGATPPPAATTWPPV